MVIQINLQNHIYLKDWSEYKSPNSKISIITYQIHIFLNNVSHTEIKQNLLVFKLSLLFIQGLGGFKVFDK